MTTKTMTMNEIRRTGIQLLTQKLGAVGMIRFLQQTDLGWGDYTKDREQWLGNPSLSDIEADIKALKGKVQLDIDLDSLRNRHENPD